MRNEKSADPHGAIGNRLGTESTYPGPTADVYVNYTANGGGHSPFHRRTNETNSTAGYPNQQLKGDSGLYTIKSDQIRGT